MIKQKKTISFFMLFSFISSEIFSDMEIDTT